MDVPTYFAGDLAVDDRGALAFVNDAPLRDVKRFYTVENHRSGFVRAWHGHRSGGKYFAAVCGAALVCAVKIDDWDDPSPAAEVHRHVLSASKPGVLWVPPGYADGSMSLTADAKLLVLATTTFQESRADEVRFDARRWGPWRVVER